MIVYVVDTETTGLDGGPRDHVVDVGIVAVNTVTGEVNPVYSEIVGYDVDKWNEESRNAWVFRHTDITHEQVRAGKPLEAVVAEVRCIVRNQICTAYNRMFDFNKFLLRSPWKISCNLAPCLMLAAHRMVDGRYTYDDGTTSPPSLEKAYSTLCPTDPAGIHGTQLHRALPDALMAAHVMLELIRNGKYDAEPKTFSTDHCPEAM